MTVLLWGSGAFFSIFLIQVIWWHVRLPRWELKTLLRIFGVGGTVLVGALVLWDGGLQLGEKVHVVFLFLAHLCVYIMCYPGLESVSPSTQIILALEKAGDRGLVPSAFDGVVKQTEITERLVLLVRGGWVSQVSDVYRITPAGRRYLAFFELPETLLGHRADGTLG